MKETQILKGMEHVPHEVFITQFVIVNELEFKEVFHKSYVFKHLAHAEPEGLLRQNRSRDVGRRKQEVDGVVLVVFENQPLAVLQGENFLFEIVVLILELVDQLTALHIAERILKTCVKIFHGL